MTTYSTYGCGINVCVKVRSRLPVLAVVVAQVLKSARPMFLKVPNQAICGSSFVALS